MISIVIIDDEEMILKGLVYTIDWLGMGISVLGHTDNGQDGMEMILKLKPDIVLTDIKMPIMDGLTMIENIKDKIEFKTVFLTSYEDFDYARKAIKLNASDYLLKPVDEVVLEPLMLKLVSEIKEDKKEKKLKEITNSNDYNLDRWAIIAYVNDSKNFYVKETFKYIEKNYKEKISQVDFASSLGISETYLRRVLRKHTGKSFVEILHAYRVNKSIKYLKEGKLRISEISEICGFNDYKHFYTVFKKCMGISPSEFLKKIN